MTRLRWITALLAASVLTGMHLLHPVRAQAAPAAAIQDVTVIGGVSLSRTAHIENLLPDAEHSGFGSLVYDEHGALVLHGGTKTWLYSTALVEASSDGRRDWYGKWVSYVREFDVKTLSSGTKRLALGLTGEERWAIIHDVVEVSKGLFVAFYSANGAVKAGISSAANGRFRSVPHFSIRVTDDWEKQGGNEDSLESNGAHVLIEDTPAALTLWLGYDSYHVDATAGQLGWAKVRIDKRSGSVVLLGKHPGNPIRVLPSGYIAARCGGNLASNIRFGDQHAIFYYSRPSKDKIMLTVALSDDALFQHVTKIVEWEPPLGNEKVIEKFETYMSEDGLHIIYENQLNSGHWGTGMRIYGVSE